MFNLKQIQLTGLDKRLFADVHLGQAVSKGAIERIGCIVKGTLVGRW